MLKISQISKHYAGRKALQSISFTVKPGAILGIIGPNGAGKTTLLDIITGFQTPDSGKIIFQDHLLNSFAEKKQHILYMPEQLEIYPAMLVTEFLDFINKMTGNQATELLSALQLERVKKQPIGTLSKCYKQRLKLFFALSIPKRIIVLDEPFDGFDPIQLLEILELLKAANQAGKTFILSIHQLYDAEKICSDFVLLDEGQLIVDGSLQALRTRFGKDDSSLEEIFMEALR